MNDLSLDAIQSALHGLSMRQRTIANNIANAETPGFIAGKVSFEGQLRAALDKGYPLSAKPELANTADPTNVNGNNVQLDDENVSLIETGLRYQVMVEALNSKFRILRTAIQER